MKSTDISLDRQASSASVIRFEKNRITDADEACTIIIMKSTDISLVGQAKYPSISL